MIEGIQEIEKKRRFDTGNLAPIEHKFIGSTVRLGDEIFNLGKEIGKINTSSHQARSEILRKVLTPLNLQEGKSHRVEDTQNKRQENRLFLKGSLVVFSLTDSMRFLKQDRYLALELSDLTNSGMVVPEWRVLFVDRNDNTQPFGKEENLSLDERFKPLFDLSYDEQKQGFYLKLKKNLLSEEDQFPMV